MAGVYELESRIKKIYAEDRTNPDLYIAMRDLTEKLLVVKGIATTREEVFSISHTLATDLYMAIAAGDLEVRSWTKYIWLRSYKYREKHLKDRGKQFFKVKDVTQLDTLRDLHSGSKYYFNEMSVIEYEDVIEKLPQLVKDTCRDFGRYSEDHIDYENILISALATIVRGEVVLFGVPKHQAGYVRLLGRIILKECYGYVKKYVGEDNPKVQDFASYFEVIK